MAHLMTRRIEREPESKDLAHLPATALLGDQSRARIEESNSPVPRFSSLLYHAIDDLPKRAHLPPEMFRRQMSWLRREGFTVEGFDGVRRRLQSRSWPDKYLVLTLDDGHISLLKASEILSDFGFGATAFIVTELAKRNRQNYVCRQDLIGLSLSLDIGSHSATHQSLIHLPPAQVAEELKTSRLWLEDVLSKSVTSFSAPGGLLSKHVASLAFETGYDLLANSLAWTNRPEALRARRIVNRVSVPGDIRLEEFRRLAACEPGVFVRKLCRSTLVQFVTARLPLEHVSRLQRLQQKLSGSGRP